MLTAAEVEAATRRFKKALLERALGAELGHHLAQEGDTAAAETSANHRNGSSAKTELTDDGALPLAIPRDRHGTCAPVLIPKHQRRFTGFDDKILALYARGLTVRDIQAFLQGDVCRRGVAEPNQCGDRRGQPATPESDQNARPLSDRRRRDQTHLARDSESHRPLAPWGAPLESGHESIRHPVWRPL